MKTRFFLTILLLLSSFPAQSSTEKKEIPFATTISGGVSLGAYQAGFNWALISLIKKVNEGKLPQENQPPHRRYKLTTMTGASAGNINILLSAIEWCQKSNQDTSAENSLFWKTWVNAGWEQITPYDQKSGMDNHALLHRNYFNDLIKSEIDPLLGNQKELPSKYDYLTREDCDINLGLTMTRLNLGKLKLSEQLEIDNQRYVSFFKASTLVNNNGEQRLHLSRHPKLNGDIDQNSLIHEFGAVADIFSDHSYAASLYDGLQYPEIYAMMMASSAFPGAFEPVPLRFCEAGEKNCELYKIPRRIIENNDDIYLNGLCTPSKDKYCDFFVDGGVFDNNPLDLAYRLERKETDTKKVIDADLKIIYIDPDNIRGQTGKKSNEHQSQAKTSIRGLGGITQLLSNSITSARQYEMQLLVRSAENGNDISNLIQLPSRYFSLYGDTLFAFGAFFGKPLRQHDFYVGAYDAALYVTCHFLLSEDETCNLESKLTDKQKSLFIEARDQLSPSSSIDSPIRYALTMLCNEEFGNCDTNSVASKPDTPQEKILKTLYDVLRSVNNDMNNGKYNCDKPSTVDSLICLDPLVHAFEKLSNDQTFTSLIAERANDNNPCNKVMRGNYINSQCKIGNTFNQLLNSPYDEFQRITEHLLFQLWRVENQRYQGIGNSYYESATEIIHFLAKTDQKKLGFTAIPDSIPEYATNGGYKKRIWALKLLIPYSIIWSLKEGGVEISYKLFEYRPDNNLAIYLKASPYSSVEPERVSSNMASLAIKYKNIEFSSGVYTGKGALWDSSLKERYSAEIAYQPIEQVHIGLKWFDEKRG